MALYIIGRALVLRVGHAATFVALGAFGVFALIAVWLCSITYGFTELRLSFLLSAFKHSVHRANIHLLYITGITCLAMSISQNFISFVSHTIDQSIHVFTVQHCITITIHRFPAVGSAVI